VSLYYALVVVSITTTIWLLFLVSYALLSPCAAHQSLLANYGREFLAHG
jgi:hypothetical protein